MRVLYYVSKVLLIISMIVCGFLNITAWFSLIFRLNKPALGWGLFVALLLSYIGIILFSRIKKHFLMFLSSLVFPLTSIVIGVTLKNAAGGNMNFTGVFLRNHVSTLFIVLFAGLIWGVYFILPEQKYKRRQEDYRELKPDEKII